MDGLERSSALTFIGGAGTVTGSKTLLETGGRKTLVDCGLFQGRKQLRLQNWEPFPVPPESIHAVVLTHAHIDHCGYLPRLVRGGFRGPVYCTEGTAQLAAIVLPDSGYLQEEEAEYANRKGFSKHDPALPLYTRQDAIDCLGQLEAVDFDTGVEVAPSIEATWRRAGHILGAASVGLTLSEPHKSVVFSGDLGRSTHPLLLPPEAIASADVMVTESTYGDENHPDSNAEEAIARVINRAAARGGVVIVPAFAVDRTEVVLMHLDRLVARGQVPDLPVFVDSPMACRALEVYREQARDRSPEFRPEFHGVPLFPSLQLTEARTTDESKALNRRHGPMIVISASGMATGGRVIHHLANRIGDDRNAVMLVGFQAPGTRGDALRAGAQQLKLHGRYHPVRAKVETMPLSSHADQADLLDWVGSAAPPPEIVYVNHGEKDSSAALIDELQNRLGLVAVAPRPGERVLL